MGIKNNAAILCMYFVFYSIFFICYEFYFIVGICIVLVMGI